jgi:hypothetical protein
MDGEAECQVGITPFAIHEKRIVESTKSWQVSHEIAANNGGK